jgi:hypothetical protein
LVRIIFLFLCYFLLNFLWFLLHTFLITFSLSVSLIFSIKKTFQENHSNICWFFLVILEWFS